MVILGKMTPLGILKQIAKKIFRGFGIYIFIYNIMKKGGILIMKVNQINNYPNNFRGYKNLKIVNENLIETADNIGAIKVFFADGKQIDKKVAEANKKAMEKYFSDRLTIAGGKEIDRKVAEANKKIAETLKSVEEKL